MKQIANILTGVFLILLLLSSCEHRKTAEEGEAFLLNAGKVRSDFRSRDSLLAYRLNFFSAEQEYDFTREQLLRLKQMQLRECGSYNDELGRRLIAETEALALQTGNDTLLCSARWDIFRNYQSRHDTAGALRVLRQQEPLVRSLYGDDNLRPYYYAMAMIYHYHNDAGQHIDWLRKARPAKRSLLHSWYNFMAEATLEAGHNTDALHYADSSLLAASNPGRGNSPASYVKGQALHHLGRTDEAIRWFATCAQSADSIALLHKIHSYSPNQYRLFHTYAALLQQTGQTGEAIRQLAKIADITYSQTKAGGYMLEDHEAQLLSTARLLAECHRIAGQKEIELAYLRRADSLQSELSKQRDKIETSRMGETLRSELLNSELQYKKKEAASARQTQYFLFAVIGLLLLIIGAGLVWWRNRRRHLRRLFDLLVSRHAAWLEIHHSPAGLPQPGETAPAPSPETQPDDLQIVAYRRLYHRVLRVMKDEKPFLNPNFDQPTLCRLAATNRTQLSAVLNRQTGMNFSNWLAEYRVNYLIGQIDLHPDSDIGELYQQAGFTSRTSFFRQFRHVTGLTPSQYMTRRGN